MQIGIFDGTQRFVLDKPIRLISLFSGYDSQALALKYLGLNYEHYKTCEWAVKSIQALKDLHFDEDNTDYSKPYSKDVLIDILTKLGISANYNEPMTQEQIKRVPEEKLRQIYNNIQATHNLVNIQQAHGEDFEIVDTDQYTYVMTYSFPCQDLSSAGLGKGMEKGSGTRSGMLWEVERILDELNRGGQKHLPQVLLMENVPEVIGTNNIKHFAKWLDKLESLGYKCYWQVLNGKDYGVPQNRERCFMVSLLGDYYYNFPSAQKLTIKLKDILEEKVDEKYYLSDRAINGVLNTTFDCSKLEHRTEKNGVMPTLCARDYKDPKLVIEEPNLKRQLCNHLIEKGIVQEGDVFKHSYSNNRLDQYYASNQSNHDCSPTLDTRCDCFGIVVNEPNEETYMGTYEYTKSDKFMNGRERFKPKNDIISTIQTSHSEGVVVNEPKCIGGIGEKKSNGGTQWYQQDRIYDDNIAISVTTTCNPYYAIKTNNKRLKSVMHKMDLTEDNQYIDAYNQSTSKIAGTLTTRTAQDNNHFVYKNLRIRKLTPKECFRLMGVRDEDFDNIAQNQSNASLYHLAGDSIIVDVLMAIFKNMT